MTGSPRPLNLPKLSAIFGTRRGAGYLDSDSRHAMQIAVTVRPWLVKNQRSPAAI
jgi:hypothetical protein